METAYLNSAVLQAERQVSADKADHFRRMAEEAEAGEAMHLRRIAEHLEDVVGIAAGLLAARAG